MPRDTKLHIKLLAPICRYIRMFRVWGDRKSGLLFSMFLPPLDPELVSNGPQDHNHMRGNKLSAKMSWVDRFIAFLSQWRQKLLQKHQINRILFGCMMQSDSMTAWYRLSVCPVCYHPKPVINDVFAALSIHVFVHECNYSLERNAWGKSLLRFFISWSK